MMTSPGFLLILTLLPVSVSSRTHSLKTLFTASSRLELVEFNAVSLVDEVEVAHFNSSRGTMVPSHPLVQQVAKQNGSLWKGHMNMLHTSQQLLKDTIRETNETNHTDQVLQELVCCEWDRWTWQTSGFLKFWLNAEEPLMFIPNSQTWISPTPEAWSKRKFENMMEFWDHYLNTVCPLLLRALVLQPDSTRGGTTGGTGGADAHGRNRGRTWVGGDGCIGCVASHERPLDIGQYSADEIYITLFVLLGASAVLAVLIIPLAAFIIYKRRKGKRPHRTLPGAPSKDLLFNF